MTAAAPAVAVKKPKEAPLRRGAVRDQVEAFGAAILAAVLLKWFCIEAFQIPTSSMQPTLMGSVEAGVYDRLLVDKCRYELVDPKRWDIVVFHYPLQKNQNYVKRMVGMPGETLHIAGGNVYLVKQQDGKTTYQVLRKPERIQSVMWKELYPQRRWLRERDPGTIGRMWSASPLRSWGEDAGTFTVNLESGNSARLSFRDEQDVDGPGDGGLVDRVWDGYDVGTGTAMRKHHIDDALDASYRKAYPSEIVADAKLAAGLRGDKIDEVAFEIEVLRPQLEPLVFALEIKAGKAQLCVRQGGNRNLVGHGEPFDLPLAAGSTTQVAFAHVDDELKAWVGGSLKATFDAAAWAVRDGCELTTAMPTENQRVNAQVVLKGAGRTELRDLRLWRDQHYTRSTQPVDNLIRVPDGHYFMMGDNTRQSVDGRDWTAFKVGMLPDGSMVPPDEAEKAGGRVVRGNKRPVPVSEKPDRDETPVVFPDRDQAVMIDEWGQVVRLKARIPPNYMARDAARGSYFAFEKLKSTDNTSDWFPPEEKVSFVPRQHIVGRALLGFWPVWPFRLGTFR